MRTVTALFVIAWTAACATRAAAPPAIVIDRTACSRCGMLISEPAHAAAMRTAEGDRLFDDIGCLVAAAREQAPAQVQYWFHDASDGQWIEGTAPVFVTADSLRTPMGGGIVAYRSREAADRFARERGGRVVSSFSELIGQTGGRK